MLPSQGRDVMGPCSCEGHAGPRTGPACCSPAAVQLSLSFQLLQDHARLVLLPGAAGMGPGMRQLQSTGFRVSTGRRTRGRVAGALPLPNQQLPAHAGDAIPGDQGCARDAPLPAVLTRDIFLANCAPYSTSPFAVRGGSTRANAMWSPSG